ncbi:hypothetical protein BC833DRAFT_72509 [Globomyces pollinis-pini]|nr:hypothetical protein BC833DRAFT_72509 [Globomyces pollinis-pini]
MTKTSHNGDETSPTKQVEVKMNTSDMQDSTKPTQDKTNVLKTGENSSNVDKPGGEKPLVKEEINRSDSVSTADINVSAPKTSLTDNHTQNIIKDVDMVSSPTKSVSDTNFVGSDVITNTQTKPEVRKLPDPIPKKQSEETIRTLPYEALPKILKRQSTNETANNQKDAITRPPKKLHREFDNKAFPVSSSIRPKEREPNRVPVASSVPKKESSSSVTSESIISFNAKHCLPLCAFHRPISSANLYFDPYPAKKESKWGIKPKPNHAKVFLDLQLALCLGMKSGYELIKTYPNLNRRVATHAEKIALEKTIVSQRLLGTMKTILDHAWIKTTVVNGIDCLRLSDIDLHIIYWDPTLYEVLRIHFKDISKNVSNLPPYWILQDLPWPNVQEQSHETNSEQSHTSRPEVYVHKKLRYKLGQ